MFLRNSSAAESFLISMISDLSSTELLFGIGFSSGPRLIFLALFFE